MPVPTQVLLDETLDRLSDDPVAKERLRQILAHERGEVSVEEACAMLGIGKTRFYQVRTGMLAAALQSVAPGRPGRPPRAPHEADEEVVELRRQVHELHVENEILGLRARLQETAAADATEDCERDSSKGGSPSQPNSRKAEKRAAHKRQRQQRRKQRRKR